MTKRKTLLVLAIAALLLFWMWPRTAMPDMEGMENIAITIVDHWVVEGIPQSESRQYSIAVGSPIYAELETLLDNTYLHRSMHDLWSDGAFKGGDHMIMLMGNEAMFFSEGVVHISNHLYSGYFSNPGAALANQIAELLADVPPLEK